LANGRGNGAAGVGGIGGPTFSTVLHCGQRIVEAFAGRRNIDWQVGQATMSDIHNPRSRPMRKAR